MRMPDFFVIGAQKAGTTTLHDWLATQTNVCLPDIKETHFFSDKDRFEKGYDWYIKQFGDNADRKIMGEVDPDYLFMPGVIEKMALFAKDANFILILRSPLKRAYSHYRMSCYRGYEKLSFIEALEMEDIRLKSGRYHSTSHFSYLSRSLYSSQIKKFLKSFPSSKFYFVKFDDLFSEESRVNEFTSICKFIGFTPEISKVEFDLAANIASAPRSVIVRNMLYSNKSLIKKIFRPFVVRIASKEKRYQYSQMIDKLNRKAIAKERAGINVSDLPKRFRNRVLADLNELQSISGLNVSSWCDEAEL